MHSSHKIHEFALCCQATYNTLSQIFFGTFPLFHVCHHHTVFHHVTRMITLHSTPVHTPVVLAAFGELWNRLIFCIFCSPPKKKRKKKRKKDK